MMSDVDKPPDEEAPRSPRGRGGYDTGDPARPPGAEGQAGQWGQWQQPGAMPQPAPGPIGRTGQPAGLGPRFVARLLDFVLLGVVSGIIGSLIVAGMWMGSNTGMFSTWGVGRGSSYAANAVSSVISAVIALGYFTLMESTRGQTVGKILLRLETRGPGGGASRSVAGCVCGMAGLVPLSMPLAPPVAGCVVAANADAGLRTM